MIRRSMADLSTSALVLVGHGSGTNPGASRSTRIHADALRTRETFKSVHVAFLKEAPFMDGLLDTIHEDTVFVVPNMASKGYLTETLIPGALGLTGVVTERVTPHGHQHIYFCDPTGTHPALLEAGVNAVAAVMRDHEHAPDKTCILIAGHGNQKNPENANQTGQMANRIRNELDSISVRCAFLEEAPYIKDWRGDAPCDHVIILPFLISGGLHGARDVPALMGLDPDDARLSALDDGAAVAGPFDVDGRRIYYLRPIGADPVVEDIVIKQAESALAP